VLAVGRLALKHEMPATLHAKDLLYEMPRELAKWEQGGAGVVTPRIYSMCYMPHHQKHIHFKSGSLDFVHGLCSINGRNRKIATEYRPDSVARTSMEDKRDIT
jgi:hypothetical protein